MASTLFKQDREVIHAEGGATEHRQVPCSYHLFLNNELRHKWNAADVEMEIELPALSGELDPLEQPTEYASMEMWRNMIRLKVKHEQTGALIDTILLQTLDQNGAEVSSNVIYEVRTRVALDKQEVMEFFKPEFVVRASLIIRLTFTFHPETEEELDDDDEMAERIAAQKQQEEDDRELAHLDPIRRSATVEDDVEGGSGDPSRFFDWMIANSTGIQTQLAAPAPSAYGNPDEAMAMIESFSEQYQRLVAEGADDAEIKVLADRLWSAFGIPTLFGGENAQEILKFRCMEAVKGRPAEAREISKRLATRAWNG